MASSDDDKKSGYILLYRSLLEWEWADDPLTFSLYVRLLLKANHTDVEWHNITIKRGQLVTSYSKLSSECGMTYKQIRGSLNKLKRAGCVAYNAMPKFGLVTCLNYDAYQPQGSQEGSQRAGKWAPRGQSEGSQRATNNKYNNYNNENKIYSAVAEKENDVRVFPPGGDF